MKRILLLGLAVLASACAGRRVGPGVPPSPPVGTIEEGFASWYGLEEKGQPTASGEIMDPRRFTAAHHSFPFGTVVRVDDLDTGRSVVVTINDRGPFVAGRIIDLSHAPAKALGIIEKGVARVRVQVVGEGGGPTGYTWRVQVGAFLEDERAHQVADTLRSRGHDSVLVERQKQSGTTYYKVWVGQFARRADADRLAHQFRQEGRSAIVISTRTNP